MLGYRASLPFPAEIAVVSGKGSRRDGVIWSLSSKTVIWIELTSPWEENMSKRHYEKKSKYNQLALELRNPQRAGGAWTVHPLEVEIGVQGAINPQSWQWMCKIMGFDSKYPRSPHTCSARCCSALQPYDIILPFPQSMGDSTLARHLWMVWCCRSIRMMTSDHSSQLKYGTTPGRSPQSASPNLGLASRQ